MHGAKVKIVQLVGFTIEIYYDAQSYKCQIWRLKTFHLFLYIIK
jgi:hypothetical protein